MSVKAFDDICFIKIRHNDRIMMRRSTVTTGFGYELPATQKTEQVIGGESGCKMEKTV